MSAPTEVALRRETPVHTFADLERMAKAVAASKLFGVKTPEEALSLMLLAQAEGRHPAIAARDYHIIEGRPALKADAMLARFHDAGGRVEWHQLTDSKVAATFSHPIGGTQRIEWSIEDAKHAGLVRNNSNGSPGMWMKYPRAMLRSRVVSEGVRTIWPAVIVGVYTPEELRDGDVELRDVTPRQEASQAPARVIEAEPAEAAESDSQAAEAAPAAAAQPEALVLPEASVAALERAIAEAGTLRELQKAHAAAYRTAHLERDIVALRRFEAAKDDRKAQLSAAAA